MNPAHPHRPSRLAAIVVFVGALFAPIAAAPAAHAEEPPGVTAPPAHKPSPKHRPRHKPKPVHVTGARAKILKAARSYIGVRYRHGGMSRAGVDCSGLVGVVYRQALHKRLPRTVRGLAHAGHRTHHPKVGDVLLYGTYHAAIVAAVSHGKVTDTIVARHTGTRVQHQRPYTSYTVRTYVA